MFVSYTSDDTNFFGFTSDANFVSLGHSMDYPGSVTWVKLQCNSGSYFAVYLQLLQVTVLNISGSFVWSSGSGVVTPFSVHL